ncbi:hypothetical protein SAMN04487895_107161 [Paenibacillus sophorae]|uniref:ABC-2 type transport system permease protein n=1 Tax=Paenibacillus sophorae TaxID=1333845 RepID=A0A1H8PDP2_9BACL|nr:hypothetical protein [Paenibacillus sophorae]QWU16539.1 hypothetical protein KP014_04720 [Paenibacillus sophorae]SEO40070.1 hypothetical protein SAMN04487895_107161 [Paenibacillus sophorae]
MYRTLKFILGIRVSVFANCLIYYFRQLPLIGKALKDNAYANLPLKKIASVIALLFAICTGFVSNFLYTGLMIYWPVSVTGTELPAAERFGRFMHIFVLLSFAAAAFANIKVLESKREKYIAVKLMRLNARQYMHATLSFRYLTFFLYFVPASIVFFRLLGASVTQGIRLALLLTLWRVACEALHLYVFDRTGIVLIKKNGFAWCGIGLSLAAAYLPLVLDGTPATGAAVLSLPGGLIITAAGIAGALYLKRYPRYRAAVDAATHRDDPLLDYGRMMSEAQKADMNMPGSEAPAAVSSGKHAKKKGYAYLNAIFFERHKRFITEPVIKRLWIIGLLTAAGAVITLLSPDRAGTYVERLITSPRYFLPVMFFISIGDRLCKALFYHCDVHLLRYGFYRKPGAVLSNFRDRLLRISSLNLIPAAAICAAAAILARLAGANWPTADMLLFLVFIVCLSLFFSVHHLFMYYLLQPYSTELNIRNPFFIVVNSIVSGICFFSLSLSSDPVPFTVFVIAATVLYIAVALAAVYKYAPRTFRIK